MDWVKDKILESLNVAHVREIVEDLINRVGKKLSKL